ncbi:MAG: hypothetical protein J0I79_33035 [Mesorhizobium sp.]|uniref:hypothetical protein n=1 Tax=Mesorhizobium sp. TaxID=1871066 RepID=UPI001ACA32CC|nr:hypothetical protein [Mesorhizobium sp.]MBN9222782.1 hypothetical protein [Mesorhizobium sp.]
MGKKSKHPQDSIPEYQLTEAEHYARKCGLPVTEAFALIREAYAATGRAKKKKPKKRISALPFRE